MTAAPGGRSPRAVARELGILPKQLRHIAERFRAYAPAEAGAGGPRYGQRAVAALRYVVGARARGMDDEAIARDLARGPIALVPDGSLPVVSRREIVAAMNRRRHRRQQVTAALGDALRNLGAAAERHTSRIQAVREAIEAHGGDLRPLQFYDAFLARLRSELRSTERSLADVFRAAARSPAP